MILSNAEHESINHAINLIMFHGIGRVDLGNDTIIYKVPSNNPKKYIIRMDIKIKEDN